MSRNQADGFPFLAPRTETYPDPYRIYNEYGAQEDRNLVRNCNESMDTMLVFSGLFSAVITFFISISYTNLSEDPQDRTNELLLAILNATRANGLSDPPGSQAPFIAPTWAIIVNVLFFSSLFLSLSAAMGAMLVKQWARQYELNLDVLVGVVAWEKSRKRYQKRRGVETWHLGSIISTLPMLIHVALLLFLTGTCLWIKSLHTKALFLTATTLFACAAIAYLLIAIVPSFAPDAPFRWPASRAMELIGDVVKKTARILFSLSHSNGTMNNPIPETTLVTPQASLIHGYDYVPPPQCNWKEDACVLLEVLRRSEKPQEHEAVLELLRNGRWNNQPSFQYLLYEQSSVILSRCNALLSVYYGRKGLRAEHRGRCRNLLYFLEWYYYQLDPVQRRSLSEWPEDLVATRFYEQLTASLIGQPRRELREDATHLADISIASSVAAKLRHVRLAEGETCGQCLLESKRPNARRDIADLWNRVLEVDSDLQDSRDFRQYMQALLVSCIWSDTDCLMHYTSFQQEEDLPDKIGTVQRTYFRCFEGLLNLPSEDVAGLVASLRTERSELHQEDPRMQWLSTFVTRLRTE
ncbi:hypothetical protein FRC18_007704 [Serendipita sp. 400]|nr:hypothetical protein FRC18_007704 [Serendipita sp. 400]